MTCAKKLTLLLAIAWCGQGFAADITIGDGYLLRPGDILLVSVWKETDLQGEVLIRPDGGISFALAGELQAAGHTVARRSRLRGTSHE